jgi:hypothetical protein
VVYLLQGITTLFIENIIFLVIYVNSILQVVIKFCYMKFISQNFEMKFISLSFARGAFFKIQNFKD